MLTMLAEALCALLIVLGAFFALVGSYGLAKLPDFMTRLHGPTKASTLGIGGVLLASMLYQGLEGRFSFHEVLITIFVFLTAPVSAFMLSKAYLLRNPKAARNLPETQCGAGWATLHAPEPPAEAAKKQSGPAAAP